VLRVKLRTLVQPAELELFFARYAECCKKGMGARMKARVRDRKKGKKGKGKK
jgi:signal recognition particle subunit SRP14